MTTFKIPKPEHLTEQETLTSFKKWQKNILFHLSVRNEFAAFIEPTFTWQKSSTTNRGLTDDPQTTENRKTALQKNIVLEQMLGLIAQFAPDLLNNEIVNKSVSLNWIWNRIRKHYSFSHSEVNFLKINTIKREPSERYETFYQRIVAHVEDNLLTVESGIEHDGAVLTADEHMSPTVERLIVNMWLNQIDSRLAAYVGRVYAHDLQKRSLKDMQPLICGAMDELLAELKRTRRCTRQRCKVLLQLTSRRSAGFIFLQQPQPTAWTTIPTVAATATTTTTCAFSTTIGSIQ